MWTLGWGLGVHSELSDGHMTWVLAFQVVGISDIFSCTYDLFRNKVESPQPCSFLPLEMYFPPGPHPPPRWFEVGAAWSYRRQQPLEKWDRVSRQPTQNPPYITVLPVSQMSRKKLSYYEEWKWGSSQVIWNPQHLLNGQAGLSAVVWSEDQIHASRKGTTPSAKTHEQDDPPGQRCNSYKQTGHGCSLALRIRLSLVVHSLTQEHPGQKLSTAHSHSHTPGRNIEPCFFSLLSPVEGGSEHTYRAAVQRREGSGEGSGEDWEVKQRPAQRVSISLRLDKQASLLSS